MDQKSLALMLIIIFCSTATTNAQTQGSLRLVSRYRQLSTTHEISEGRLEIYLNNAWGNVCSTTFNGLEANISCIQLGFLRSRSYGRALAMGFSTGNINIVLHELQCATINSTLLECATPNARTCSRSNAVAVSCLREGTVRLISTIRTAAFPNRGRLEIFYEGNWATICYDANFDTNKALTVCEQLGYLGANSVGSVIQLSTSRAPVQTPSYNLNCSAQRMATRLPSLVPPCDLEPSSSCTHDCDVAVFCAVGEQVSTTVSGNTFCFVENTDAIGIPHATEVIAGSDGEVIATGGGDIQALTMSTTMAFTAVVVTIILLYSLAT